VSDRRSIMRTVIISNLVLMFGFNIWRAVFNNLVVEDLGLGAGAVGAIQSLRELPGLMGFLFVLMVGLLGSELRVMGANILILGAGLIFTGLAPGLLAVVAGTLVTSIGFHYFSSGSQAVTLQIIDKRDTPRVLGRLSSVGALAAILATVGVFLGAQALGNRQIMIVGGVLVLVVGLALLPKMNVPGRYETEDQRARESVRRRYWLYYALTFLMGTRRHIFTTFAIFMLVEVHDLQTSQTALLFLLNSVVSFLALPQLGRLVGRFGERRMLTFNFFCLIGIFLGYAMINEPSVLIALFIVDNLLFGFSLALNSYFQKIALIPQDITPNMSLGQSINHVAAVIIPLVGGILWETVDPAMPFLGGAVIAVVSLLLLQWMRTPRAEPAWGAAT
jgi:predicted MFS family arabinose efflux permease